MVNEVFGWTLVLASLLMGLYLGVKFQRDDWLGGYNAFPRRMLRLGHISLAALGTLNILFAQTAGRISLGHPLTRAASLCFMAGAVLMPVSCLWLAARRRGFSIFLFPIGCLFAALVLTIGGLRR